MNALVTLFDLLKMILNALLEEGYSKEELTRMIEEEDKRMEELVAEDQKEEKELFKK